MDANNTAYWAGVLFGGFVIGGLCGALPLKLALNRGRRTLAFSSWIMCVISGLVLGLLLAVPMSILFTVIILCLKKPEGQAAQVEGPKQAA